MPRSSDTVSHQTSRLVEAGEILGALSPPTLAALHLLIDYDVSNQSDMADIIGCARPTVSRYLQSLANLPMPLARKQGRHYRPTESGRQVFTVIENMLDRLGSDLREIEWSDEDDQEDIEDKLSPLHDSRSTLPFLILESIRLQVNFLDTPEPINVEDIIIDVRARQRDVGKSVTAKQIRKILWRFDEKNVIEFDGGQVTLDPKKGKEHVRLLHKLAQLLEGEDKNGDESTARASSLGNRPHDSDQIARLLAPREFRGGSQTVSASREIDRTAPISLPEPPTIVPAYYLISSEDVEMGEEENSESKLSPLLPFTSLTVRELANYVDLLEQEYDGDALLEPYWALQTEAGLSPLGPAQLTLGPLSEEEL